MRWYFVGLPLSTMLPGISPSLRIIPWKVRDKKWKRAKVSWQGRITLERYFWLRPSWLYTFVSSNENAVMCLSINLSRSRRSQGCLLFFVTSSPLPAPAASQGSSVSYLFWPIWTVSNVKKQSKKPWKFQIATFFASQRRMESMLALLLWIDHYFLVCGMNAFRLDAVHDDDSLRSQSNWCGDWWWPP